VLCDATLDCKIAVPHKRIKVAEQSDGKQAREEDGAARAQGERRARHRVRDDQQSGQGSATALSKLKMIERKRAPLRAVRESDD
jgi:hypothetical protein